jgi:hypothetical protein
MGHAWCHDVARDEAVRAAEDGRTGPLPTLDEAIAMIPKSGSSTSAPEPENKGVHMTKSDRQAADYRAEASEREAPLTATTERVTLEITYKPRHWYQPKDWHWLALLKARCESVRVVEETHFDDLAQAAMERDAAIRERDELKARVAELEARTSTAGECLRAAQAASGGGEPEPVAWMCEWTDHTSLYQSRIYAERAANGDIVPQPLYRSPPQPRGWLTEEERKAVDLAAYQAPESDFVTTDEGKWINQTLTAILARLSPPEVVLPMVATWGMDGHAMLRRAEVQSAIAAAGVAVKEVPRG